MADTPSRGDRLILTLFVAAGLGLPAGCGVAYDAEAATPAPTAARRAPVAGFTMNLAGATTPGTPLTGMIGGRPFTLDRVEYHDTTTTVLLHGREGQTVFVFLFLEDAPLAGVSRLVELPRDDYDQPHVHIHYPTDTGNEAEMFSNEYVIRLELGAERSGSVPAHLYLCLPDENRSWLAGTFDVHLP